MNFEIERKYLIKDIPDLSDTACILLEQAYLCHEPVVRVRASTPLKTPENAEYYLTYKGAGLMSREEYNLPLTKDAYHTLSSKAEGLLISKKRYIIPYGDYIIELDVFDEPFAPLIMAEVEFDSEDAANAFSAPIWFGQEVTMDKRYHNSNMSKYGLI